MAEGLTPELRPDKTGKIVTRHVKTSPTGSSAPRKTLPSPTASSHPKRLARDAMRRLKENGIDLYSASSGNSVLYYLASVSPELLERTVTDAIGSNEIEAGVWAEYLGNTIVTDKRRNHMWKGYVHLGTRIPTAVLVEEGRHPPHHANNARKLLELVDSAYPEELDRPEFLRAASIVLQLKGENSLFKKITGKHDQESRYEQYRKDIEFIATRVDDVEMILPVLRSRDTTDPQTVGMLLQSESLSLSDGML